MAIQVSAREAGRKAVIASLDPETFRRNTTFASSLQEVVKSHPLMQNPIMKLSASGHFSAQQMKFFHYEFYHAFAQVFTDTVIEAMRAATQLDDRLGARAKMAARFLLQINLLDELGFEPGLGADDNYVGRPEQSHYVQFFETVEKLGGGEAETKKWMPLASAIACRHTFESTYGDYCLIVAILAVAETVFHDFATPWASGVSKSNNLDISTGYHSIHVEDEHLGSIEDGHSEDAWMLFTQAVTEERFPEITAKVRLWMKMWNDFCNDFVAFAAKLETA